MTIGIKEKLARLTSSPEERLVGKKVTKPNRKPAVTQKQDDPKGTATVTCSALNVRADANKESARIGGLIKGQTVSYYEEKNGWLKIPYGTGQGWICAQYTTYKAPSTPTTEPTTPSTEPTTPSTEPTTPSFTSFDVKVTPSDGLNVRTGPGTNNAKIGALNCGEQVTVIGEQNGWYQIKYQGQTGWISAEYTSKVSGGSTTPTTPSTPTTSTDSFEVRVTADSLNVRTGPGTSNNKIGALSSGTKVTVLGQENGWYKIDYNGQTGWICADYTVKYQPGTGGQAVAVALAQKYIGKRTFDLVGVLPYLQNLSGYGNTNGGLDNNCANFVSALLQNAGLLNAHYIGVYALETGLKNYGYRQVSLSAAQPGDVWMNASRGHTELVEYGTGSNTVGLIGSNNQGNVQYVSRATKSDGIIYSLY